MNAPVPQRPPKQKNPPVYEAFDWVETFLAAFITVILVFTFLFRIVVVNGTSMTNTLQENDYLILSKLSEEPKRGEIVVLQVNTYEDGKKPLIKRVIATGGQWVDIDFDTWSVYVGDTRETMEKIEEDYVLFRPDVRMHYAYTAEEYPKQVPEGKLFVMGDNRNGSMDSRDPIIGFVPADHVLGRAVFRLFPLSSIGALG